jgi:hypothetical protein
MVWTWFHTEGLEKNKIYFNHSEAKNQSFPLDGPSLKGGRNTSIDLLLSIG